MATKLDLTKPVQFRNNPTIEKVEFLRSYKTAHGVRLAFLATYPNGNQYIFSSREDGMLGEGSTTTDVINTPETIDVWVNIYRNPNGTPYFGLMMFATKEQAVEDKDKLHFADYIGTINIKHTF